jgi:hypothetical protein
MCNDLVDVGEGETYELGLHVPKAGWQNGPQ